MRAIAFDRNSWIACLGFIHATVHLQNENCLDAVFWVGTCCIMAVSPKLLTETCWATSKGRQYVTLVSLPSFLKCWGCCTVVEPFQLQLFNAFLTNCLWRALTSKLQIHPKWVRQTIWTVDTVKQFTSWWSRIMFYTTLYVSNTSAIPTWTNLRAVIGVRSFGQGHYKKGVPDLN